MARKRTITNPAEDSSLASAIVRQELQNLENEVVAGPSIFGAFGGDGNQGAITVSSDTNVSAIDDANIAGVIQATSFNLATTKILTVDTGWLFLGVQGTCTIAGIIDANGQGEAGGSTGNPGTPSGYCGSTVEALHTYIDATGVDKIDNMREHIFYPVPGSLAGAGGSGGKLGGSGALYRFNMPGGGAGGKGGVPAYSASATNGVNAETTATSKMIALSGGLGDNSVKGYSHFNPSILAFRGAGGAGGNAADAGCTGGNGGGVIYIECNELVFTGTLRANGANGASVGGGGSIAGPGGGGGGVILVRAKTITTNSGTVTVTGGSGGSAGSTTGGNGAAGFKQIVQVLD